MLIGIENLGMADCNKYYVSFHYLNFYFYLWPPLHVLGVKTAIWLSNLLWIIKTTEGG